MGQKIGDDKGDFDKVNEEAENENDTHGNEDKAHFFDG